MNNEIRKTLEHQSYGLRRSILFLFTAILLMLPEFNKIFDVGFFELIISKKIYGLTAVVFLTNETLYNICMLARYCFLIVIILDIIFVVRNLVIPHKIKIVNEELRRKVIRNSYNTTKGMTIYNTLVIILNIIFLLFKVFAIIFGFAWIPFVAYFEAFSLFTPATSQVFELVTFMFGQELIYLLILMASIVCCVFCEINSRIRILTLPS